MPACGVSHLRCAATYNIRVGAVCKVKPECGGIKLDTFDTRDSTVTYLEKLKVLSIQDVIGRLNFIPLGARLFDIVVCFT
jgi:hypothetical protein